VRIGHHPDDGHSRSVSFDSILGWRASKPKQSKEIERINAKILLIQGELMRLNNQLDSVEDDVVTVFQEMQENAGVVSYFMQAQQTVDTAYNTVNKINNIVNTIDSGVTDVQNTILAVTTSINEVGDLIGAIPVLGTEIADLIDIFTDGATIASCVVGTIQDGTSFIKEITTTVDGVLSTINTYAERIGSLASYFSELQQYHAAEAQTLIEHSYLENRITADFADTYRLWAKEQNSDAYNAPHKYAWLLWRPIGTTGVSNKLYNFMKTRLPESAVAVLRHAHLAIAHALVIVQWMVDENTKRMLVFSVGEVKTIREYFDALLRGMLVGRKVKRLMLEDSLMQWEDVIATRASSTDPWVTQQVTDQDGNVASSERIRIEGDVVRECAVNIDFPRAKEFLNCMRGGLARDGIGYSVFGPNCQTMSETFMQFLCDGRKPPDQVIWNTPEIAHKYNWWNAECSRKMLEAYANPDNYTHDVLGVSEFHTVGISAVPVVADPDHYHSATAPTSNIGTGPLDSIHGIGTTIGSSLNIANVLNNALAQAQSDLADFNSELGFEGDDSIVLTAANPEEDDEDEGFVGVVVDVVNWLDDFFF
jgi:hypothetical protein